MGAKIPGSHSLAWIVPALLLAGCATTGQSSRVPDATGKKPSAQASRNTGGSRHTGTSISSRRCMEVLPLIEKVAGETGMDAALMVGLVRTESNFRNDVSSPVGAYGLAQIMPATARAKKCGDLKDPYQNLLCGARVLAAFLKYYGSDLYLGLSGYNAGHSMPNRARNNSALPANADYIEQVLWGRARFLARGCDF